MWVCVLSAVRSVQKLLYTPYCCPQVGVGGLGYNRILYSRMRETLIKINEESGRNPEIRTQHGASH